MTRIARSAHLEDQNLTSGTAPLMQVTVAARAAGATRAGRRRGAQLLAEKVIRLPPSAMQVTAVESPDLLPLQA